MGRRSINPDLIFSDVREERASRIVAQYSDLGRIDVRELALDRTTVFVTHRCNFACRYCNGPHVNNSIPRETRKDFLSRRFTRESFKHLLDDWEKHKLRQVHFTGGEATLNPDLPWFIEQAAKRKILVSLTTNGSSPPALYRRLVESGMTEVRISIDSHDASEFDKIVGVNGAFRRVENTIRELVRLRDEEQRSIFIILNVSTEFFDLERCKHIIDYLLRLRPDDMKLLVIAESASSIQSKASRKAVDEILDLVRQRNPDGYELLEKKVRTLFRKNTFGLKGMDARYLMKRCYIPLTERTLDAKGIYPCSIYLRYTGNPLAPTGSSFEEQQAAINAFVENHDCKNDPICSVNCTKCCRDFNVDVGGRILAMETEEVLRKHAVISIGKIRDSEVGAFQKTVREINAIPLTERYPFFIVKPYGMNHADEIIGYLKEQGIVILEQTVIRNWAEFSLLMYADYAGKNGNGGAKFRIARNRAFRRFEGKRGFCLRIEKEVPLGKIYRIKSDLRRWFGEECRVMAYDGRTTTLHANVIHSIDQKDLEWTNKVVIYWMNRKSS